MFQALRWREQTLSHDGLMRPVDLLETDMGVGLVYDYDPAYQRLDLWMGLPEGHSTTVPRVDKHTDSLPCMPWR